MDKIVDVSPCFRLFHDKGDIGCRGVRKSGNIGVLLSITNSEELLHYRTLKSDDTFILLLKGSFFNASILHIIDTKRIQGILVYDESTAIKKDFNGQKPSADGVSPSSNVLGNYNWNEMYGNGILMQSKRSIFHGYRLFDITLHIHCCK